MLFQMAYLFIISGDVNLNTLRRISKIPALALTSHSPDPERGRALEIPHVVKWRAP